MKVEFSNNGVTDSLTGAPAPKNFFENLLREIAKSARKYQPLAVMTFKYVPLSERTESEKELTNLGQIIKKNMRQGDFYSRVAQDGYWLCLHGDEKESEFTKARFKEKLSNIYESKSTIEIAISLWDGEMNLRAWVEAIDSSYFNNNAKKTI